MRKIIIYTQAYNAEHTLRRAVDSVLSQTYVNFEYILVDNGSTDKTGEIIEEYANEDSRIVSLSNKKNHVWEPGNSIADIISSYDDTCILCWFDADDELDPRFFEKMLVFMERNNLDIAICGSDFIDSNTNMRIGSRKFNGDLVLKENFEFSDYFIQYYQFIRPAWAKLYSFSVLRNFDFEKMKIISYGWDTYFVIESLHHANRVGILGESLHKYFVSQKSTSYYFDPNRINSDGVLFDVAYNFLNVKCGRVSEENLNFLYQVYFFAMIDTINVLLNAQISVIDKLYKLRDIFLSQHSGKLIQRLGDNVQQNEQFNQVVVWVLSQKEVFSDMGLEIVADILLALGMDPSRIKGWQDCWMFKLLTKIRSRLIKKGVPCKVDELIVLITSKWSLFAGLNVGFLMFFHEIIFSIMQNDEKKALSQIQDIILQGADIPNNYIEAFLLLGLNLSARLELMDEFVYFKKLQVSALIDFLRIDEAREELADWDDILPSDNDFKELREKVLSN